MNDVITSLRHRRIKPLNLEFRSNGRRSDVFLALQGALGHDPSDSYDDTNTVGCRVVFSSLSLFSAALV